MASFTNRVKSITKHFSLTRSNTSAASAGQHYDVVIIGGGNSAGYVAKQLDDLKWKGTLAIISAEPVAPYERPALTKAFLHPPGAKVRARLPGFHTSVGGGGERQTEDWYKEHKMTLMLNTRATNLDLSSKSITVENEKGTNTVSYSKLILATGARALSPSDIRMENPSLENVFTIREEKEAMEMISSLEKNQSSIKNLVIVGGGYIGMETAAALTGWGFQVTMIFPDSGLMSRLFPSPIAQVFEAHLESRGVKILKGAAVKGMVESKSNASVVGGVKLGSGEIIDADAVVFGVGSRLNMELFEKLGSLERGEGRVNGIKVNGDFQTTEKDVYAIGDIAALNGTNRYEHVDFCRQSAARAASSIATGKSSGPFPYVAYFYSRLFEYTSTPVVFQFYGNSDTSGGQSVKTFGAVEAAKSTPATESMPTFGAAWVDSSGKVCGLMLCNASADQYAAAKEAVVSKSAYESLTLL